MSYFSNKCVGTLPGTHFLADIHVPIYPPHVLLAVALSVAGVLALWSYTRLCLAQVLVDGKPTSPHLQPYLSGRVWMLRAFWVVNLMVGGKTIGVSLHRITGTRVVAAVGGRLWPNAQMKFSSRAGLSSAFGWLKPLGDCQNASGNQ